MSEKPIEETAGEVQRERGNTFNGLPRRLQHLLYIKKLKQIKSLYVFLPETTDKTPISHYLMGFLSLLQ